MKAYKSYMDKVTIDPALQEKIIMETQKTPRVATSKNKAASSLPGGSGSGIHSRCSGGIWGSAPLRNKTLRFTEIAACAAALLFVIWILPSIFSNYAPTNGLTYPTDPETTTNLHTMYTSVPPIIPEFVLHALTFREVGPMTSFSRALLPPGYFDYDLTEAQLNTIFPALNNIRSTKAYDYSTFGAAVAYRADGSLRYVSIGEFITALDPDVPVFANMGIVVGMGEIPGYVTLPYGGESIISYIHGIPVAAYVHTSEWGESFFLVDFTIDDINYHITLSGYNLAEGQERMTKMVNWLVVTGPADLSILLDPVIPELRNEELTLAQAQQDPDFGQFIPTSVPDGFIFSNANRIITTRANHLTVSFMHDVPWQFRHTIMWSVAVPTAHDLRHIVCVSDHQKYDVSLYPFPWAGTVPREYRDYFHNPVFLANEISLETVQARTWWEDSGRGDTPGWRTHDFSVLHDDVIIRISVHGLSAEQIWEMIRPVLNFEVIGQVY